MKNHLADFCSTILSNFTEWMISSTYITSTKIHNIGPTENHGTLTLNIDSFTLGLAQNNKSITNFKIVISIYNLE